VAKLSVCPNCGIQLLPALYGMPSSSDSRDEYFLQGCMIPELQVDSGCNQCGYSEYEDGSSFDPVIDRKLGAIFGLATGDALGEPYEFKPPVSAETPITFDYNDNWHPGQWTDDTAMAIAIMQSWVEFGRIDSTQALDDLVARWLEWSKTAPDCGVQTRLVFQTMTEPTADAASDAAKRVHDEIGRSGGNGSLMRTSPLAFFKGADDELVNLITRVSKLTHYDDDAAHACIVWVFTMRHAIETGRLDFEPGLAQLPEAVRGAWRSYIEEAKTSQPVDFENNGWVIAAFKAAASAVFLGQFDLFKGLEMAVRSGFDADTVAAIAGSLLGALHGLYQVPEEVKAILHGWPNYSSNELVDLSRSVIAIESSRK
jgi:ADP-ribosylglycohydrolase